VNNESHQAIVIRLPAGLVRSASRHAESGEAYESLSELVATALRNQLALETEGVFGEASEERETSGGVVADDLLALPPHRDLGFADRADEVPQALSAFTNRLFPIKLACRVAANLASGEDWANLAEFRYRAADAARRLGIGLRRDDEAHRRRGADRRWIALPVGSDAAAAARRFAAHFTIDSAADGRIIGPMGDLGLANAGADESVQLTELGWALARAPSPLLGESKGHTLGTQERSLFFEALRGNASEVARISEFTGLLRATTEQGTLDELLAELHPRWSDTSVRSHRAAMLGRLGDLEVTRVTGRGPGATVRLGAEMPEAFGGAAAGA
jgi:hypothetical protein